MIRGTLHLVCFGAFAVISLAGLSACGIKPSKLEPPSGAENDTFPRTYPDPTTY